MGALSGLFFCALPLLIELIGGGGVNHQKVCCGGVPLGCRRLPTGLAGTHWAVRLALYVSPHLLPRACGAEFVYKRGGGAVGSETHPPQKKS